MKAGCVILRSLYTLHELGNYLKRCRVCFRKAFDKLFERFVREVYIELNFPYPVAWTLATTFFFFLFSFSEHRIFYMDFINKKIIKKQCS